MARIPKTCDAAEGAWQNVQCFSSCVNRQSHSHMTLTIQILVSKECISWMIITSIRYSNAHCPMSIILPALNSVAFYTSLNTAPCSSKLFLLHQRHTFRSPVITVAKRYQLLECKTVYHIVSIKFPIVVILSALLCHRWLYRHIHHIL